MLRFKLFKIETVMHFSFFAVIALLGLIQDNNYMLLALIACILHEFGHIFLMCLFGVAPKRITFYGAGIKITPNNKTITSNLQDFIILIGGSVTNLIILSILYPLSKDNFHVSLFAIFNLIIGVFNLIPFKHFDGGKIIELFLVSKVPEKSIKIRKIIRVISIILLLALAIWLVTQHSMNVSLYFSIGFIIFSELIL